MPSKEVIQRPLTHFFETFKNDMNVEDHMEFFCNRKTADSETYLRAETYVADKLSRVVMEEYCVRSQMKGCVIMTFPQHDNDVPIFFFQIGGRGDRSIAVLDIAPTLDRIDYTPLIPVFEKYREALGLGEIKAQWLKRTSSPYLLSCQYDELDCDLFNEAMEAYLDVWLEHYYRPGRKLDDQHDVDVVTNALFKFKYVLHHHDPAYGIFAKSWGKGVADAFVHLECSDYPAYRPPKQLESRVKPWNNSELNVEWTEDAQLIAEETPEPEQSSLRRETEQRAAADGFGIITTEIFDRFRRTLAA